MPAPSVWFEVLSEGYKISGGRKAPLRAVVPYIVKWEDAFTFVNEIMGDRGTPAYALPASPNLLAENFECEPIGQKDGGPWTNEGLSPGEAFTYARINVEFTIPEWNPLGSTSFQLDPANPQSYCEVEVDNSAKVETEKGAGYEFDDGTPLVGDVGRVVVETRLTLTFPELSSLPWQLIRPYLGKLNDSALLDCPTGTMILEGAKIKFEPGPTGVRNQSVQLIFLYQDYDWNMKPRKNGVLALVRRKGDTSKRIYSYASHSTLLSSMASA